jgi:hypothetical protein
MVDGEYWDSVQVKIKTPPRGSFARAVGAYDVPVGIEGFKGKGGEK